MFNAISETNRRREIQKKYNEDNHITPVSVHKEIREILDTLEGFAQEEGIDKDAVDLIVENKVDRLSIPERRKLAVKIEKQMKEAAKELDFEEAARLRDLLIVLKTAP
jgi:excinuclease ABC subunit B